MTTDRKLVRLIGGDPGYSCSIDFEGQRYVITGGKGELPEEAIPQGIWGFGFYRAPDEEPAAEDKP